MLQTDETILNEIKPYLTHSRERFLDQMDSIDLEDTMQYLLS